MAMPCCPSEGPTLARARGRNSPLQPCATGRLLVLTACLSSSRSHRQLLRSHASEKIGARLGEEAGPRRARARLGRAAVSKLRLEECLTRPRSGHPVAPKPGRAASHRHEGSCRQHEVDDQRHDHDVGGIRPHDEEHGVEEHDPDLKPGPVQPLLHEGAADRA